MFEVVVRIERYVDDHPPGFVECSLVDAFGKAHVFIEKAPVVAKESLLPDSLYPRGGAVACRIVREWLCEDGRPLVLIDTEQPWGIASTEGESSFVVSALLVSEQQRP